LRRRKRWNWGSVTNVINKGRWWAGPKVSIASYRWRGRVMCCSQYHYNISHQKVWVAMSGSMGNTNRCQRENRDGLYVFHRWYQQNWSLALFLLSISFSCLNIHTIQAQRIIYDIKGSYQQQLTLDNLSHNSNLHLSSIQTWVSFWEPRSFSLDAYFGLHLQLLSLLSLQYTLRHFLSIGWGGLPSLSLQCCLVLHFS
jgi:hypothetical protein